MGFRLPGTLELYLEFLRSGSLDDPVTALAKVGLDMTSSQVIEVTILNLSGQVIKLTSN